jgi:hypothetical protein
MLLKDAVQAGGESFSVIHGTVPTVRQAVAADRAPKAAPAVAAIAAPAHNLEAVAA